MLIFSIFFDIFSLNCSLAGRPAVSPWLEEREIDKICKIRNTLELHQNGYESVTVGSERLISEVWAACKQKYDRGVTECRISGDIVLNPSQGYLKEEQP